jgi:uncharacterized membrane protein YecN with MAPEG domain
VAWPPPPLPREHGAWVMLLLPLLLGSVLAGARLSAAWLLPPAVVLVFLAHYAIVPVAQRRLAGEKLPIGWTDRRIFWAVVYFILASLLFAGLVIFTPPANRAWLLLVCGISLLCGAASVAAACARAGRLIIAELPGMLAMALSAPIMALAAGAPAGMQLVSAPALAFAYSISTLSYVRAYGDLQQGRRPAVIASIAAHIVILGGLALLCLAGWLSPWALLAFTPLPLRTAWGLTRPPSNLRAIGMREIWVALSFAILAGAAISL